MSLGAAAIGIGATLLSKFVNAKTWTLINLDTNEVLQGQFPPDGNTESVGASYAEINGLNRQHPILQFIGGESDKVTLQARFYKRDLSDDSPVDKIKVLKSWARRDAKTRRPPILVFALGGGDLQLDQCVLEGVRDIQYSPPDLIGGVRQIRFSLELKRYKPFDPEATQVTDTRYARAKDGDYYEFLAQQEYGDPLIGDVIRKLHPTQLLLEPGNIVKLPSIEGVRKTRVTQTSIALKTAFGRKDTPQRRLRILKFQERAASRDPLLYGAAKALLAFTPRSVPHLAFWLPRGGVNLVGDQITAWTDVLTQADAVPFALVPNSGLTQPDWNANQWKDFVATTSDFIDSTGSPGDCSTLFGNAKFAVYFRFSGELQSGYSVASGGGESLGFAHNNFIYGNDSLAFTGKSADQVLGFLYDGTTGYVRRDGKQIASKVMAPSALAAVAFAIGRNVSLYMTGSVLEVIGYSHATWFPSAAQMAQIESFMGR